MKILPGFVFVAFAVVVFSMLAGGAEAHHSWGGYSADEVILEGVVTEFVWRNPHVQLLFDVTKDSGEVEHWRGELSAVTSMIAAGLSRTTFRPGDSIRVAARVPSSGKHFALLGAIWDGDGVKILEDNYRAKIR